jgi:hypothetical protein
MEETSFRPIGHTQSSMRSIAESFSTSLKRIGVINGYQYLEMLSKSMAKSAEIARCDHSYEDTIKSELVYEVRGSMIKKKIRDYFKVASDRVVPLGMQDKLIEYVMVLESYLRYCTTLFLSGYCRRRCDAHGHLVHSLLRDYRVDVTNLLLYPQMFVALFNDHDLSKVTAYRPCVARGQGIYYNLSVLVYEFYSKIEDLIRSEAQYEMQWCCIKVMDTEIKNQLEIVNHAREEHFDVLKNEKSHFDELEGKINECISTINHFMCQRRQQENGYTESTPFINAPV